MRANRSPTRASTAPSSALRRRVDVQVLEVVRRDAGVAQRAGRIGRDDRPFHGLERRRGICEDRIEPAVLAAVGRHRRTVMDRMQAHLVVGARISDLEAHGARLARRAAGQAVSTARGGNPPGSRRK
jgi:hypothetical protein